MTELHEQAGSGRGFTVPLHTPDGILELTLDEYRLALLGLIDFEGNFDALLLASSMVKDGEGKARIVRERLAPIAVYLPALLARGIDSIELLSIRYWFREAALDRAADVE